MRVAPSVHGSSEVNLTQHPKVSDGSYGDDSEDKELGMQGGKPEFRSPGPTRSRHGDACLSAETGDIDKRSWGSRASPNGKR